MAETGENNGDYQAHAATWNGFVSLMKWGTILSFLIGAAVVLLIAS